MQVVGEAPDGAEAIREVDRLSPDVILMDLVMPAMDGIEAIEQIIARHPEASILVLTSYASDDKVLPALRAGARGYLLKVSPPDDVLAAIRRVYRGEAWLDPGIARQLLDEISTPSPKAQTEQALTGRELEVLRLVARGQSNRDIASALEIREPTVRTHVSHVLSKLHLASRTQAALYALREGWASLEDGEP